MTGEPLECLKMWPCPELARWDGLCEALGVGET